MSATATRTDMLEAIDRLEAAGMDCQPLRLSLEKLRLPDDVMIVTLSHRDTVVGAVQLRSIVKHFGDRMPVEAVALLERLAAALIAAEVRQ